MIPVLAVHDVAAARRMLAGVFGFSDAGKVLTLGGQSMVIVGKGEVPGGFVPLRLDHVAISVADADEAGRAFLARGANYARAFTPEGPKEIPEFWESGVRFVFFDGPEGWPLEFCALRTPFVTHAGEGHSHYGIRSENFEVARAELQRIGASLIARHSLTGTARMVNVAFLGYGSAVLELFDEPPFAAPSLTGWIGLVPS